MAKLVEASSVCLKLEYYIYQTESLGLKSQNGKENKEHSA
jgi:hypothetical protein